MSKKKNELPKYIVVEVSDRNHHLCTRQIGEEPRYKSMMNGRSRGMVEAACKTLNDSDK